MADEKILTLIKQLLNIAQHPNTPPEEADTAQARATKLMVKNAISEMQLTDIQDAERVVFEHVDFRGSYALSYLQIGVEVAAAWGTVRSYRQKLPLNGWRLTYVGFPSDIRAVRTLVLSLDMQAQTRLANWTTACQYSLGWLMASPYQRTRLRADFLYGFAVGAGGQLTRARAKAVEEVQETSSTNTELALRDRSQEVDDVLNSQVPNLQGSAQRKMTREGFMTGFSAGQRANVGGNALDSGS